MDIRRLDLNLLRTLNALLDERSVTRAGLRLGLTQSAVSASLGRLRGAFADPLFVRAQRGVAPTPRALGLADPVRRLLADAEALLRATPFSPETMTTRLSVAATDYSQAVIITPAFAAMRPAAPGLQLAVRPLDPRRLAALVEDGEVDLAVLSSDLVPPSLHSMRLLKDGYVLAGRRDHPELGRAAVTLERFCELEHALVSPTGGSFRGPVDVALETLGLTRNVTISVSGFLPLLDVLQATDLVAAIPARLVREASNLSLLPLPFDIPSFTMVAAWHERTHHDPGHGWVRAQLAAVPDA